MRIKSKLAISFFICLFAIVLFPPKTHAYIDPATGSYILQIVVAGIAASAFTIKIFWRKIKAFISTNLNKKNSGKNISE